MKKQSLFARLVCCWLLSSLSLFAHAQQNADKPAGRKTTSSSAARWFQHLTLRSGLETNYVTSVAQDTLGFIWFGTVKGLTRFDGLNCRTFTRRPGDGHSLSHRIVRALLTARNGSLWVGTQEGLNQLEPATQTFRRYPFAALGTNRHFIRTITESADGKLWCGTKDGVVRFDPVTGKAQAISVPADSATREGANSIRSLLIDGPTLWIGTQAGLYAYDWRIGQFRSFRLRPAETVKRLFPDEYVTALARYPRTGELVIGARSGRVTLFNAQAGTSRQLSTPGINQAISALLFTKNGDLWVGLASGGLQRYDPELQQYTAYLNDELNPHSLGSNLVKNLFEDRSGVLWIGSDDAGVSWLNPTVEKFHSLFDEVGYRPASSLGLTAARLSIDQKNCLWVASHDGLIWIDPQTLSYRLYRHDPRQGNSLGADYLHTVLADRQGQIWAGGPRGLTRFDPATNRFTRIPFLETTRETTPRSTLTNRQDAVAGEQVFTAIQHRDGRIFIGTNEKLTIYNPKSNTFSHQYNDERIRKLPGANYNTCYLDRHNNLWVGGLGPVYKIGPDLQLLAQYVHQEDDPNSLPDEGVTGFTEDASGDIWLSTDNGLARLNEKTGRFTVRPGLPGTDMAAVLSVGDTLWVTSSRGLACVDTRRLKATTFDEADGLPTAEFESDAVVRDSAGRIYFGTMRGLVYVQPANIRLNPYVPPVFITSFRVDNQELLRGAAGVLPTVVLDYTQNSFTFDMAVLSFDNPSGNRYSYRLEGFEDNWNQSGNRHFASYTNVPPDEYILHVIGANNDGVWNREGYRLRLIITPPFWQTWWFRGGVLAALVALTVMAARWRVRRLVQEQAEKSELRERIAASEMKALRSQMNPHFLYNSLNAIRLFVLQNDSDNADKYLVKFSRLMRLILENSRQEWVSLASELEQLQLYLELEQLRFGHKFDFAVEASSELDKEHTFIPPMIVQPYIENAILHGVAHKKTKGRIDVCIRSGLNGLECIVDDDGVGRQKAGELKSRTVSTHKSMGLKVTEERLQLISQRTGKETSINVIDKVNDEQEATGTKVVILLPPMPA